MPPPNYSQGPGGAYPPAAGYGQPGFPQAGFAPGPYPQMPYPQMPYPQGPYPQGPYQQGPMQPGFAGDPTGEGVNGRRSLSFILKGGRGGLSLFHKCTSS